MGFPLLIFEKGAPLRQIQGLWEGSVTCHYQLQDVTFFWWATDACIRTPVLACIVPSNQRDRKHGLILSFWKGCWYQVVMTSYFVETIIFGLWGPFTEEYHLLPSGYHISWHCSQCRFRDGPWKKLTIGSQEFPLWYKLLTQNLSSILNITPNLLFSICSAHECPVIPNKDVQLWTAGRTLTCWCWLPGVQGQSWKRVTCECLQWNMSRTSISQCFLELLRHPDGTNHDCELDSLSENISPSPCGISPRNSRTIKNGVMASSSCYKFADRWSPFQTHKHKICGLCKLVSDSCHEDVILAAPEEEELFKTNAWLFSSRVMMGWAKDFVASVSLWFFSFCLCVCNRTS